MREEVEEAEWTKGRLVGVAIKGKHPINQGKYISQDYPYKNQTLVYQEQIRFM